MAIKTFTTGEVLTASDTNTYLANSGLVYITSGAMSSSTPIDGIFTSTYDNYRIVIANLGATAGGLLNWNYRTTSNTTESANNYYSAVRRYDNGTNYDFSQGPNTYGTPGVNVSTSNFGAVAIDFISPRLATRTTAIFTGIGQISQISSVQGSVLFNDTTQFAGIIFSLSANTINNGTYTVYGYRKA